MPRLRSHLFELCYYLWTIVLALAVLPFAAFLKPAGMRWVARLWMTGIGWLAAWLIGLHYRVEGQENLAGGPFIIAAKHQSAWETLTFHKLVPNIAIALKRELTRVPIVGWYLMIGGNIRLDRSGGSKALRLLIDDSRNALARGCSILIFPEGTRRAIDAEPDYKSGVMALYRGLDVPVVPVALNSGLFWPRGHGMKRGGVITVRFLEPIPAGLDRRTFMTRLETVIEQATADLVAQAPTPRLPDEAPRSPVREDERAY